MLKGCETNNGGCQQGCHVLNGQATCFCQEGYTLGSDRQSCLDVDECSEAPCEDICINTEGSFHCECSGGALLLQDGRSCNLLPDIPVVSHGPNQPHIPPNVETCAVENGDCEQVCITFLQLHINNKFNSTLKVFYNIT